MKVCSLSLQGPFRPVRPNTTLFLLPRTEGSLSFRTPGYPGEHYSSPNVLGIDSPFLSGLHHTASLWRLSISKPDADCPWPWTYPNKAHPQSNFTAHSLSGNHCNIFSSKRCKLKPLRPPTLTVSSMLSPWQKPTHVCLLHMPWSYWAFVWMELCSMRKYCKTLHLCHHGHTQDVKKF